MEILQRTLLDWDACMPEEGGLNPERVQEVLDRAAARVLESTVPSQFQQDAYALLEPEAGDSMGDAGQPPLMERMLLRGLPAVERTPSMPSRSGRERVGGGRGGISFLRFWQAWQELWRRLGYPGGQATDEPFAEELASFRDALLRRTSTAEFSAADLAKETAEARRMSADQDAWGPLEEAIQALTPGVEAATSGRDGKEAAALREPLSAAELSEIVLQWIRGVVHDYQFGPRAAKIRTVKDVCRCSWREACFQLGGRNWDVEAAMMGFYKHSASGASIPVCVGRGALLSWSSQGARLRQSEVECPICCEPYADGAKPVVIKCCYQVLCKACHEKLSRPVGMWPETEFQCPFCRGVELRASPTNFWTHAPRDMSERASPFGLPLLHAFGGRSRQRSGDGEELSTGRNAVEGTLSSVFRFAGAAATEAGRLIGEMAALSRDDASERFERGAFAPPHHNSARAHAGGRARARASSSPGLRAPR